MGELDQAQFRGEHRLNGWREIAAYCRRTESTVKRWAADLDLPVHRRAGEQSKRGVPVYALPGEIDAWLRSGRASAAAPDEAPPAEGSEPRSRRVFGLLAAAGIAGIVLVAALGWAAGLIPGLPAQHDAARPAQAAEIPEEARELYLRGTYLWNRRSPEGIAGAIETLGRAIEIHPDYAEAHASLAMTYNLARQYSGMSGWEAYPKAEEHARRAVELDPTLGFAHSVLAFVEFHWLWDVEAGLSRFEQALQLEPDSSNTLLWYASSLLHARRPEEALPLITRAQQSDPDSSAIYNMKALALFFGGEVDMAEELLGEIMERDPQYAWSYPSMSYIQLSRGDYAGYLENYARLGDLIGVPRYRAASEAGAAALADGGPRAMAAAMIAVETEYYERGEALAWDVARHHAIVGDAEGALRWLRIGLERKEERLIGLWVDFAFRPISEEPEFLRFAADVGLPTDI